MKNDIRKTVKIYKSLTGIRAQLLDGGNVLAGRYYKFVENKSPVEQAATFGVEFGKLVREAKESKIVFDRSKSRYHGQVKSFAEGLRKAGLEF